jgi:hypothetical protein
VALTAAELRTRGDATGDQRAELKALLETRRYTKEWRDRLFGDIAADGGLTQVRANAVLHWLRQQPDLGDTPIHATADQLERIDALLRERIAPGPWARQVRNRIAAGTVTHDQAELYLTDLGRLPKRAFAPTAGEPGPRTSTPDGYYSLTGSDGRVRSYRVHTPKGGRQVVDLITGDQPGQRRRIRGYQTGQILRAIAAGAAAAAALYGVTRKACSECNQPLRRTDQPGFPHGYGPDCWDKRQLAATVGVQAGADHDDKETDRAEA